MKTPPPALPLPGTLALAAILALVLAPCAARAQGGSLPAHPRTLLETLPDAPQGWKITKSRGANDYAAWIITEVSRHFEKTVFVEGEDPNKPSRTEFKILDSGGYRSYLSRFANFTPDPKDAEPGTLKSLYLGGSFPAFVEDRGTGGIIITLLARTRYVVTINLYNQPSANVKNWLEAMKFSNLAAIPDKPFDLADEFTIVSVDELDPSKNSSYTASINSADFAERFALMEAGVAAEAGLKSDALEQLRKQRAEPDEFAREFDAEEASRVAEEAAAAAGAARGGQR